MSIKTTLGIGIALAALLTQIGCSKKDSAPEQGAVAPQTSAAAPAAGSVAPSSTSVARSTTVPPVNHSTPAIVAVTLPEGTKLAVRTTSTLSTNAQLAGQSFAANLELPLMYGGREIAPKGAEVEGRIVASNKGGRVKGRASLSVQLSRLHMASGRVLDISTSTIAFAARATKRKDATKIGVGAGIGAALGAIFGGGKGAAIGAAAGGAGGTGLVLATHGEAAVIPSETVLHFALRSAVTIPGLM